MDWWRALGIVIAGGLVLAVAAFVVTSQGAGSCKVLGGPGIHVVSCPGFDAWTGQPHSLTVEYNEVPGIQEARPPTTDDLPAEVQGRLAISLPIGFTVGLFVSAGVLVVTRLRRDTPPQATA